MKNPIHLIFCHLLLLLTAASQAQTVTSATAARDLYLQRISAAEKVKNDGIARLTQDFAKNTRYAQGDLKRSFEAMIRTAAMRNQTEEVRSLTLQMESLINPNGAVSGSSPFRGQGTDYKELVGTWTTLPSSGTAYTFEFKANKNVLYTYEYKSSTGGSKSSYEYRATQKADSIVLSRSSDSNTRFEIKLPFDPSRMEITRHYESSNSNSSYTYILVKQP